MDIIITFTCLKTFEGTKRSLYAIE